jgi:hypothetical protein
MKKVTITIQSFFERPNGDANAIGINRSGNLIRIISSHCFLSSLQIPEINGRKNKKLIPHNRGDKKKILTWSFRFLCNKETSTNTAMLIDKKALEKNNDAIIVINRAKMTELRQPLCSLNCMLW